MECLIEENSALSAQVAELPAIRKQLEDAEARLSKLASGSSD